MNRQIYKMTLADDSDSITFYLLEVPIVDNDIDGTATNTTIDGNVYRDYMWLKKQWKQKWSIMCRDEYDKLRGIFTRQYTDAEVATFKLFYGDNIFADGSEQGNPIQINNDSEVYEGEIQVFSLLGNTTQTTLSGKNKIVCPVSSRTNSGVLWTITADTITASGTASANWTIPFDYETLAVPLQPGTYTISIPQALDQTLQLGLRDASNVSESFNLVAGETSRTFTCSITAVSWRISYYAQSQAVSISMPNKLQLEAGSTATDYEQFCGGVPSPNPDFPQVVNTVSGEQTVEIVGKNLFDRANAGENTLLKWTDGLTQTENKTISSDYMFISDRQLSSNYLMFIFCYDSAKNYLGAIQTNGTIARTVVSQPRNTWTIPSGYGIAYIRVEWRTNPNGGADMTQQDIMLNYGSTATTYEPYQGQSYEINLGKNLFSGFATLGTGSSYSNGTLTMSESSTNISNDIVVAPNKTYYLNFTAGAQTRIYLREYDGSGTQIVSTTKYAPTVITTNADTKFMRIYFSPSTSETFPLTISNIQLELGSQATSYSAYKTPIELAKIDTYQDYIYKSGDKWYKHAEVGKVIYNGTENITNHSTKDGILGVRLPVSSNAKANTLIYSDYMRDTTFEEFYTTGREYGTVCTYDVSDIGNLYASAPDSTHNTVDTFKTWLSTHNMTVYYALATPTDTEITDSELVGQLEALLAGSLYKGTNNIFLIPSGGANGTFTLAYRLWYEKETTVQDTTPILLDLKDGGVINACGCRQNVEITMRETVQ